MKVEIWSDVVCPWCYIGKRRFEAALEAFAHADDVEVTWRAFQLDPGAISTPAGQPAEPGAHVAVLAEKYGSSVAQVEAMQAQITATAAELGLEYHLDAVVPANTVDAHQVIHLAAQRGGPALQGAVKERLMRACFTDGEAVGDAETLVRLAGEAGLAAEEVRAVLAEGRYLAEVRRDQQEAAQIGVRGVPFFVIDRRYGVSGAQPADQLLAVLERAWTESSSLSGV